MYVKKHAGLRRVKLTTRLLNYELVNALKT
jgi:hypothetical protein